MCQELQICMYIYIYIYIYVFGCKLSLFRLCDRDLGITPVDDITVGTTHYYYYYYLLLLLLLLLLLCLLSQASPPGTSLEPAVIPTAQASSFTRIMCDVPSIAVFCSESVECFPGTASKYLFSLLLLFRYLQLLLV
jgi:hypothetical protein